MLATLLSILDPLEVLATLLTLGCVWLTARQDIRCWPVGIAATAIYAWIFFGARLYSDAGLQVVFVVLQIYGWWYWLRGGERRDEAPVRRIAPAAAAIWAVGCTASALALGATMSSWTDAALPWLDATATVLSLAAQWLMGRKILESWLIWVTVDVLSIGMYAAKGLYVTLFLYTVLLGLAVAGFLAWRRSYAEAHGIPGGTAAMA